VDFFSPPVLKQPEVFPRAVLIIPDTSRALKEPEEEKSFFVRTSPLRRLMIRTLDKQGAVSPPIERFSEVEPLI